MSLMFGSDAAKFNHLAPIADADGLIQTSKWRHNIVNYINESDVSADNIILLWQGPTEKSLFCQLFFAAESFIMN